MNQPPSPTPRVGTRHLALLAAIGLLALAGGVLVAAGSGFPAGPERGDAAILPTAPADSASATRAAPPTATPATAPTSTPTPSRPSTSAATAVSTPAPTPAAAPSGGAAPPLDPPPSEGPFEIDLFRAHDFVSESRNIFCVPAAMQTMVNIMSPGADQTGRTQRTYYALARELSPPTLRGDGAEPEGWAEGLDQLGFGPYEVQVQPTRTAAIHVAAHALRMTGRPVGLLVWAGVHSWVMSGFRATADPALSDDFEVTDVYIEDVWYPRISSIWGASRPPDTLVPVGLLPEDFLRWKLRGQPHPGKDGKFVMVVPLIDAPAG